MTITMVLTRVRDLVRTAMVTFRGESGITGLVMLGPGGSRRCLPPKRAHPLPRSGSQSHTTFQSVCR